MDKVRLGIVGPGRIVHQVMKDLRRAEHIEITAVASRSAARAKAAAEEFDIPKYFDSYEALAASDAADLVYVALPHPFHCAVTKLFLESGKHVIVEKPFAINAREAREMVECATAHGRFLMEAMWSRFFPLSMELKARVKAGDFGRILRMTGAFAFKNPINTEDRLFNRALGGGSLLDVGIYPLSMMCYYKDALPEHVQVFSTTAQTGVDGMCAFQLQFADGCVGQGFSALEVSTDQTMRLYGTESWVEVPDFWHPTRYIVHHPGQDDEQRTFEDENMGYRHEFERAARAILAGQTDQPVIPLSESVRLMELMDRMRSKMGVTYPGDQEQAL